MVSHQDAPQSAPQESSSLIPSETGWLEVIATMEQEGDCKRMTTYLVLDEGVMANTQNCCLE